MKAFLKSLFESPVSFRGLTADTAILFLFILSTSCNGQQPGNASGNVHKDSIPAFRSDSFWKSKLSPAQFHILREKGTEKPYTGKWLRHHDSGIYTCSACGYELFRSDSKFDAHCGWPSFDDEIQGGRILKREDRSHGMVRTEIMCANCGGHLGHLFDDGPTASGKRYCVNSLSLDFITATPDAVQQDTIILGGGCFWCTEAVYQSVKGIVSVMPGYSGGKTANPTYEEVCSGNTGHAEVVQVVFDPSQVGLSDILRVFFSIHDPTTLNRQGADIGTQYRSVIYYRNSGQKKTIEDVLAGLRKSGAWEDEIVTATEPFTVFYPAEDYHLNYYRRNSKESYCRYVIKPKLDKFEKVFSDLKKPD